MSVRTAHRDVEQLAGQYIGGGSATAQVGGPARGERSVDPLRTPQSKLEHVIWLAIGGGHRANACGLGGHQALEIDHVEKRRFD